MIELLDKGVYLLQGQVIVEDADKMGLKELNNRLQYKGLEPLSELSIFQEQAHKGTIAYQIGSMASHDITYPDVVAVYLIGSPMPGVGPQDVALDIIKAILKNNFVKNKVMEFVGPGISNLSVDYRNGIDVMTTETTCLTSIWRTDEQVKEYFEIHGRPEAYCKLEPKAVTYYDGLLKVDLSRILPCPKNALTDREFATESGDSHS